MPPSRVGKTLNLYGDLPNSSGNEFGHDISSQRLDDLDYECLRFVISERNAAPRGIDLGSGMGTPSVAFALAGARMTLIDLKDLSEHFERLAELLPTASLRFERLDLVKIPLDVIPIPMDFIYSQRTLHYLPYPKLLRLLSTLVERMKVGGRAFISVSGLDSELGDRYVARNKPLETRFARLDDTMATKHNIAAEVCLYTRKDLTRLALAAGLATVDVVQSPFGNIKGVFEKPTLET